MVQLETVRQEFASRQNQGIGQGGPKDAAVAMVLRGERDDLEVCFIQRADRTGDRWSGQIAFPGGRPSAGDRNLRHTAERETLEEIGLDLSAAEHLGALPAVPIHRALGEIDGHLSPFVYYLGTERNASLALEPGEVADAFWTGIQHLLDPERRTSITWGGVHFPAIRLGQRPLWGLTLRVWQVWCQCVGAPLELQWPHRI